jgi:hypothetical protein
MKLRIAALALAVAFAAAPALGALRGHDCCAEPEAAGPCSSLVAMSCCGDIASNAPAKSSYEGPTLYAVVGGSFAMWIASVTPAPRTAHDLVATISPLRLSVVRRL